MKHKLILLLAAGLLSTSLTSCYTDPYFGGGYTSVGVSTYRPYYGSYYGLGGFGGLGYPGYYGYGYRPSYYSSRYYSPLGFSYSSRSYGYPYRSSYSYPSRSYAYSSPYRHYRSSGSSFGGSGFHHHTGSFGGGSFHHSGSSFGGHHHHH